MFTEDQFEKAYELSISNKKLLEKSEKCSCFSCKKIFEPSEILGWVADKHWDTWVCPHCWNDTILAWSIWEFVFDKTFLELMNRKYS